jgi:hypothetical protein
MRCPNGHDVTFPPTTVPPLSVCPVCGRTVVLTDGSARLATFDDTQNLTDDQKIALRKLRPTRG